MPLCADYNRKIMQSPLTFCPALHSITFRLQLSFQYFILHGKSTCVGLSDTQEK